ncbi:DUF6319 family protein [Nocardia bhagyanarayanae]|uniref:Uncharacterized protein n=1 Tax=Nocardia bhagyanarayanae TaxID=1215925 RepID=A0A543FB03_9NOCA|nr:DUF6319 family protein [Nocardia bhagyanarayanae]TQM31016.1 hypothetical protein FB390_2656 [Nocardia bhagyanarayanae]
MPSPRTKPKPLSDTEIEQIAAEIAGGRPPMVWFTAAAVGVPEGRSGKVIALGDPSDGDFLQVRPTGSKDVLSFSPTEVTLTKPSRDRAAAAPPSQPKSTTRKDSTVTQPSTTTSAPAPTVSPAPVSPAPKPVAPVAETSGSGAAGAAKPATAPKPAKAAAARKAKAAEVTVTLSGTADGEWTVEVVNGKKRSVRGLPVNSSAVAQAAKILHPEVAEVVAGVLEAARGAQLAKVEQLQAELEEAKRLLDELTD